MVPKVIGTADTTSIVERGALEELLLGLRPLTAAFLGISSGVMVVFIYTYGVFMPFLMKEFGGGRAMWSLPIAMFSGVGAVCAPGFGKLVDRYGPLRVCLPALLLSALTVQLMATFASSYAMLLGFIVTIAIFGSGTHNATYLYVLGGKFHRARGLAIGIALSSTGLCGILAPQLAMAVSRSGGWRAGYSAVAVVFVIAAAVLAVLLWNAGPRPAGDGTGNSTSSLLTGMTLKEARGTPTFWKAALVMFLFSFGTTGQVPHVVSIAISQGIDPQHAAQLAAILGGAVIIGRLGAGFLLDRVFMPYVGVAFLLIAGTGQLAMSVANPSLLPFGIFALGLGLGAEVDLIGYSAARYFGNRHYGSIFGLLFTCYAAGSMLGPVTVGAFYDYYGSYAEGLRIGAALMAVGITVILLMPRYPSAPATTSSDPGGN